MCIYIYLIIELLVDDKFQVAQCMGNETVSVHMQQLQIPNFAMRQKLVITDFQGSLLLI